MAIWRPYTPHYPDMPRAIPIRRAQGAYLYTADGRALWDATCAWWVCVHGHCHPHIAQAIAQQAHQLDHVLFADFTHEPAEKLADRLARLTGLPWVFFSDNGSTAVEVALKIAIQYFHNKGEKRHRILALEGAYHGDTFGAMSASARGPFTKPFTEFLFEVEWLPFPEPFDEAVWAPRLEALAERRDIAAFIAEPLLQGVAGMRTYTPQAWDAIVRAVRAAGALIIADEVFTGFGRTGRLFATDHCTEKPDLLCLSKGITGGFLPLGLTLAREEVFEAFFTPEVEKALYHGHSYTGNPIACAAALANLELWEEPETWARLAALEKAQRELAQSWQSRYPHIPVRHLGIVLAIELPAAVKGYFAPHRVALKRYGLERGVFFRPLGQVAYILPVLASTPEELAYAVSVIESYLAEGAASM
ncbi:MAG: adenosylmethionine--8-amino-7-oxononanoate transaminase [Bacteroidia bacterium]